MAKPTPNLASPRPWRRGLDWHRDNGMDPLHLLIGLVMGQNGVCNNHLTEAERVQDEDYNGWFRYRKIDFSFVRG